MLVCWGTSQYIPSWTKYISVYAFYIEVYHIIPLSESPWVSPWVTATSQWKSPIYTEIYWVILSYTHLCRVYLSIYHWTSPPSLLLCDSFCAMAQLSISWVYLLAHFPCYATTAVILSMAQLYSVILSSPGGQLSRGNSVNWAMLCVSSSCTLMTVFFRVLPRFPWKADHLDISV